MYFVIHFDILTDLYSQHTCVLVCCIAPDEDSLPSKQVVNNSKIKLTFYCESVWRLSYDLKYVVRMG
jgi:hypothetical protein